MDRKPPQNFVLPIKVERLRNASVQLVPLNGPQFDFYADELYKESRDEQLWKYVRYGPFSSSTEMKAFFTSQFFSKDDMCLFAIIVSAATISRRGQDGGKETMNVPEGTFAGITGLISADIANSRVEIGHVMVLPRFQRTFVLTTVNTLLLHHLLDPLPKDLGLRRVEWHCNSLNLSSRKAAERLGFHFEGITRYAAVLPSQKESATSEKNLDGIEELLPRRGADNRILGSARHTVVLSLCWDDWATGGKQLIDELCQRYRK